MLQFTSYYRGIEAILEEHSKINSKRLNQRKLQMALTILRENFGIKETNLDVDMPVSKISDTNFVEGISAVSDNNLWDDPNKEVENLITKLKDLTGPSNAQNCESSMTTSELKTDESSTRHTGDYGTNNLTTEQTVTYAATEPSFNPSSLSPEQENHLITPTQIADAISTDIGIEGSENKVTDEYEDDFE